MEPSTFFDEAQCGPLLFASHNQHIENALVIAYLYTSDKVLYCMVVFFS